MSKPKYTARVDKVYFLSRIGLSLRWVTQDIAQEDLPAEVKRLLARLDRLEARPKAKGEPPDDGPGS